MCFSSTMSFTAAGLLTIIGAISIRKAPTREWRFFAATPLLFAIQQAAEGTIWLTYSNATHASLCAFAAWVFSFFAYVLWPAWVPFAVTLVQPAGTHRSWLFGVMLAGFGFSTLLLYYLMKYGIVAHVDDQHIRYLPMQVPPEIVVNAYLWFKILYVLITTIPFFMSSYRVLHALGLMLAGSYLLAELLYSTYLTSVWCFFAALLSGFVYIILDKESRRNS